MLITILGIESSCDDTSAAVIRDGYLLSNVIAGQDVHKSYGGVVPELASRSHLANIIPVVDQAIKQACIKKEEISAISFTLGPGLLGSLLVGTSFAKGLSLSLKIPLIEVNHLHGHVLSHFIIEKNNPKPVPKFPHLCLLISGGHTQIIKVDSPLLMKVIGNTIDDAVGEAFDKAAKVLGLPYPGGPVIDKLALKGNPNAFTFAKPRISELDFSFSGLKTSFLYFLRDKMAKNPEFITREKNNLCASLQQTIVEILLEKITKAVKKTGIKEITISGGVSANMAIRKQFSELSAKNNWNVFIPPLAFSTDNAAMIAITGYYKFQQKLFAGHDVVPIARFNI
ncbi:MAG: tRNA (adenosine(37)-N6)-threonylcarbamoyltransferase complex transferase subunit TsaD [Bacteroidetes bacterium CG23_combo_of_CG06-09_8_20_14_all_32_9]|nr:MAG: tRNA (adenosine(37)-N6)-threonylcarbamoyltransferase complex transferase subunit TsaD [Bacteroidetes bacterium CG23_combo_of_CG06-09_8_20_14_all_32_9]